MKTVMIDNMKILEEKKNKLELKIKEYKRKKDNRKRRAKHLIEVGALLEIVGIDQENKNTLLGYLIKYKDNTEEDKIILTNLGKELFKKRKFEKDLKKKNLKRNINSLEILELLKISQKNDIFSIITKEFKKKLLEQLTFEEYLILIKRFKL